METFTDLLLLIPLFTLSFLHTFNLFLSLFSFLFYFIPLWRRFSHHPTRPSSWQSDYSPLFHCRFPIWIHSTPYTSHYPIAIGHCHWFNFFLFKEVHRNPYYSFLGVLQTFRKIPSKLYEQFTIQLKWFSDDLLRMYSLQLTSASGVAPISQKRVYSTFFDTWTKISSTSSSSLEQVNLDRCFWHLFTPPLLITPSNVCSTNWLNSLIEYRLWRFALAPEVSHCDWPFIAHHNTAQHKYSTSSEDMCTWWHFKEVLNRPESTINFLINFSLARLQSWPWIFLFFWLISLFSIFVYFYNFSVKRTIQCNFYLLTSLVARCLLKLISCCCCMPQLRPISFSATHFAKSKGD